MRVASESKGRIEVWRSGRRAAWRMGLERGVYFFSDGVVGLWKGRVWPVVVTTEPYQCEAGYQPPNIEVGVTLVHVTRLPQAPTHIHTHTLAIPVHGFSRILLSWARRAEGSANCSRGESFLAVNGWAAFLHAVCVVIDKDRSGARVWDRLKGNVAPFDRRGSTVRHTRRKNRSPGRVRTTRE